MSLSGINVCAASSVKVPEVYFSETFNNYVTGTLPTVGTFMCKNAHVVKKDGVNDKALYAELDDGMAKIGYDIVNATSEFSVSFRMKLSGGKPTTAVKVTGKNKKTVTLFSFDATEATSYNGFRLKGLKENCYQTVTVSYSNRLNSRSISIDGKKQISNQLLNTSDVIDIPANLSFDFFDDDFKGNVCIDDIIVYEGTNYYNPDKFSKAAYNNLEKPFFPDSDQEEDAEAYITDNFDKATVAAVTNKDNVIERVPDEVTGNGNYMKMTYQGSQDMYFVYNNGYEIEVPKFVVQFDVLPMNDGTKFSVYIKDKSGQNMPLIRVDSKACTVSASTGGKLYGTFPSDQWSNIALAVNTYLNTYDVYINNELFAKANPVGKDIAWDTINWVHWYCGGGGTGSVGIDNVKIYPGKAPRVIENVEMNTVMTNYEKTALKALKDTIDFHADSDYFFNGKERVVLENKAYVNDQNLLMVSVPDLEKAFNLKGSVANSKYTADDISLDVTTQNNINYIKLQEYAEKAMLQLNVTDRGLNVFNKDISSLDETHLDQMNDYMIYEHPSAKTIADTIASKNLQHPYLLADHDKFEYIKSVYQTDPTLSKWATALLKVAETYIDPVDLKYEFNSSGNLLNVSRAFLARAQTLAMAYYLTDDTQYSDALYRQIQTVSAFPDWHHPHYLDTSEMSLGFGIAYDWAYAAWTDEQKAAMKKTVFDYAIDYHYDLMHGGAQSSEVLSATNRGIVNNAGCVVAAMAFYQEDPEKCSDMIANAIWGMDIPMRLFFPSGSWYEGPGYWSYTIHYLAMFMSSIESMCGSDYGVYKAKGFSDTGDFAIQSSGGTKSRLVNNFHDCGHGTQGNTKSYEMLWLSNVLKKPSLQTTCINDRNESPFNAAEALLWYNLDAADTTAAEPIDLDAYFSGEEFFSMRSSFNEDATIIMAHAGKGDGLGTGKEGTHNHLDNGTFVIDMLGERFAEDLGSESYDVVHAAARGTNGPHPGKYFLYRLRPLGHNCLVINPENDFCDQEFDAFCPVTAFESKNRGGYVVADMTTAYARKVNSAQRGYKIADDRRSIIIRDEISSKETNNTIYWGCHTMSDIDVIDNNNLVLTLNAKKVKVSFITNAPEFALTAEKADYLPGFENGKVDTEASRDEFKRIQFKLTNAPRDTFIQAKFIPLDDVMANQSQENVSLADWSVPDGELQKPPKLTGLSIEGNQDFEFVPETYYYDVYLDDLEHLPAITAVPQDGAKATMETNGTVCTITVTSADIYSKYYITFKKPEILAPLNGMNRLTVYNTMVSSIQQSNYPPKYLHDGDVNTKWSADGDGEWAVIDLGSRKQVDSLGIGFVSGDRIYKYDILISDNNEEWLPVFTDNKSCGVPETIEYLEFNKTCRYIKFVGHCSNTNTWNNLSEFAALVK